MLNTIYKKKALILFSFFTNTLFSQNNVSQPYKFSEDIIKESKIPQNNSFELSCIGEYEQALKISDNQEEIKSDLSVEALSYFNRFKPINAIEYITNRAKKEKVIIFNEAHSQPYHRVLVTSLLEKLNKEGFKYLFIETLNYEDTFLETRKYPLINSGGYSQEPLYGDLIRKALQIGYKVLPYEDIKDSGYDSLGNNLREVEQAKNINKVIAKDTNAKFLIYCGFGHIKEGKLKSWGKAMAGRLIEYSGINPFTIEQVSLTEHSKVEYDDPYYRAINLSYYAVFVDSSKKLFNGPEANNQYDVRVYHPRTKIVNGRPHWMFENDRKPYFLSLDSLATPCIVQAFLFDEKIHEYSPYENPVPYDVIEIQDSKITKALSLKSGKYRIIITDKKGAKIEKQIFQN